MEIFNTTSLSALNLLNDKQFNSFIQFQANYGNSIRGGHLPNYFSDKQRQRLITEVNLLTEPELRELVQTVYQSKN